MATIWAIGRNYKDHAAEMKAEIPKEPMVFIKSEGCLSVNNLVEIPTFTQDLHHEIEIAVKLGPLLIPSEVALALDLTARDLQSEAKSKGHPWALAKSFLKSCPVSHWISFENRDWFQKLGFQLEVNGQLRQKGQVSQMIFNLDQLIEHLKSRFPVSPGDIILTGTPAGVAALKEGDQLEACLFDLIQWKLRVVQG